MKSVIFSFATHNHQPLGNFEHVFERAYAESYLPFFALAEHYPKFRFATHFTGILLEWIEETIRSILHYWYGWLSPVSLK